MTTIQIAFEVSADAVAKIETHLEDVAARDINWNGANFQIERDDFTCIPDNESPSAIILLHEIMDIIDGRTED